MVINTQYEVNENEQQISNINKQHIVFKGEWYLNLSLYVKIYPFGAQAEEIAEKFASL